MGGGVVAAKAVVCECVTLSWYECVHPHVRVCAPVCPACVCVPCGFACARFLVLVFPPAGQFDPLEPAMKYKYSARRNCWVPQRVYIRMCPTPLGQVSGLSTASFQPPFQIVEKCRKMLAVSLSQTKPSI